MSGSQIGGVIGGAIGAYFGGPAGAQFGYAIGSAIGGYIDPTKVQGPRLTDATQQTSTVGGPIPFGYGVFTTAGNIIWTDKLIEHRKRQREGKGGGVKTTTYTYTRSFAVGVCEGPIHGYVWIKQNGKLVYAADPTALGTAMGWDAAQIADLAASSAEFLRFHTLYYGTADQMPDSTIVAVEGVGNVSPHRDLAYIVAENVDLTDLRGAPGQYEFCVRASAPDVYLTSPPYPVVVEDSVGVASRALDGFRWRPPQDQVGVTAHALDGVHRALVVLYQMEPEEIGVTAYALNGVHRLLVVSYQMEPEEIGVTSHALDGEHRLVRVDYLNYVPEEIGVTAHALNGEHRPL